MQSQAGRPEVVNIFIRDTGYELACARSRCSLTRKKPLKNAHLFPVYNGCQLTTAFAHGYLWISEQKNLSQQDTSQVEHVLS